MSAVGGIEAEFAIMDLDSWYSGMVRETATISGTKKRHHMKTLCRCSKYVSHREYFMSKFFRQVGSVGLSFMTKHASPDLDLPIRRYLCTFSTFGPM